MKKNMQDITIFVSSMIPDIGIDMLRNEGFTVLTWNDHAPIPHELLIEKTKNCDALLSTLTGTIDAALLNECSHLQFISQYGVGYDNINIAEATKLGIPVSNTPGVLTDATADIAFGLMIAVARKMFFLHKKIEQGEWKAFTPRLNLGIDIKGKTLGIFGMGRIGKEVARRCKGAYGMKILYHNRTPDKEAEQLLDAKYVSFEQLLAQSDIVSVHSALTAATKGVFNKAAFSQMKPTSIFINTARGGIHNEEDLIAALRERMIWGAGLDVTNPEPMHKDNPLLSMDTVAVLPHIGSATAEARGAMSKLAAENIIAFYTTGHVPHLINPEVVKKGKM